MSCFGTVSWYHVFPTPIPGTRTVTFVDGNMVVTYGPSTIGLGYVDSTEGKRYAFSVLDGTTPPCIKEFVAFDIVTGHYAANLVKALRVPTVVRGRVTGWTWKPWSQALEDNLNAVRQRYKAVGKKPPF